MVRASRNAVTVLDQHGNVRDMRPAELTKKHMRHGAVCLDSEQNSLEVSDVVEVVQGFHRSRQGTIKHIFRAFFVSLCT